MIQEFYFLEGFVWSDFTSETSDMSQTMNRSALGQLMTNRVFINIMLSGRRIVWDSPFDKRS